MRGSAANSAKRAFTRNRRLGALLLVLLLSFVALLNRALAAVPSVTVVDGVNEVGNCPLDTPKLHEGLAKRRFGD